MRVEINPSAPLAILENEQVRIACSGYSVRSFLEDQHVRGSWGYTVGLRDKAGLPICIYMRAGCSDEIIQELLEEICVKLIKLDIGHSQFPKELASTTHKNLETNENIRIRLKKLNAETADSLSLKYETPIEAQEVGVITFWALLSDKGDHLPGEVGYEDWNQISTHKVEQSWDTSAELYDFDEEPED